MKLLLKRIMFASFFVALTLPTIGLAQAQVVETDDPAKIEIYTRFYNNDVHELSPTRRQGISANIQRTTMSTSLPETLGTSTIRERKQQVPQLLLTKNFSEVIGLCKQCWRKIHDLAP